jgi:hypothetical protein
VRAQHQTLLRDQFRQERAPLDHRRFDSRNSRFSNKELLDQWAEDYGEDSEWYRVRIKGLPPTADELQFIDRARINEAQRREPSSLLDDPST